METSWRTLMPAGWEPVVPFDVCFDAQYGLDVLPQDSHEGLLRARVEVRDELRNHLGELHGGVFASAAEALASRGTALAVMPAGRLAMGLSNDTSVIASPRAGAVTLEARALARGDDAWLWTVDAHDAAGRLCAHSRVTVAVRAM
jgi:uncharacterized protein (TIGR00369 family)